MTGLSQMLTGMRPIDNLHPIGEPVVDQIPDLGGAIGGDTAVGGLGNIDAASTHLVPYRSSVAGAGHPHSSAYL